MALAGNFMFSGDFDIEGCAPAERGPAANLVAATSDYFRAVGPPLIAGRYFTADEAVRREAVLINQAATKDFSELPAGRWGDASKVTAASRVRLSA